MCKQDLKFQLFGYDSIQLKHPDSCKHFYL